MSDERDEEEHWLREAERLFLTLATLVAATAAVLAIIYFFRH
jgi:hypothetical protein